MLKNFFKTAFRNILKYQSYALINFIGLTSGLALSLLIIVYVRNEIGFDRFHTRIDRLYRLSYQAPNGLSLATSPPPIATYLKDHFNEVEKVARVYGRNVTVTRDGLNESFEESDILFADSTIADLFTFQFVKGNPEKPLHEKFTVIINEEMARKYFGDANPIGESLTFSGRKAFKVIGVVKNFPEQSHIRFNMLVPYENMFDIETERTAEILRKNLEINFIISHSYTYLLLRPGADPEKINKGMDAFLKKYAQPRFLVGQVFTIMPVADIHLESELLAEPRSTNSWSILYVFLAVGALTLVIACINYINLSTAQSFTRIKEIGIRKIMGSMRYQLIAQFLAESFMFCVVSFTIAYVVFYLALPVVNQLTDKQLVFAEVVDTTLLLASVGLLVLITLMAGGYPAYFITRFESVNAIRGSSYQSVGNQFLRKGLVVFQLTIASMLLSGSLLIMRQLRFLQERPLGFQKEQIINVPLYSQNLNGIFMETDSTFQSRLRAFRNGIESLAGVRQTALSSGPPGLGATFRGAVPEGFTQQDNLFVAAMVIDYDFIKCYDMEVIAGRGFDREFGTDEREGYLVNETAVREFKWGTPQNAIGKTIDKEGKSGKVVGVLRDFNFASMSTPMSALVMDVNPDQFTTLSIKFETGNMNTIVNKLQAQWNGIFPEKAFEYTFLNESINRQYADYQNFGIVIQAFTGIAVLISCLGVYGLVLFTVQRKVKEIGVRKVLGADLANILYLIYRDFALLTVVGFAVAIPASYYFMSQWLDNFIYRTDISVTTYVVSLVGILVIVSLTVSYQAVRAALENPVKSLRSE